jgi:hypothetical protein
MREAMLGFVVELHREGNQREGEEGWQGEATGHRPHHATVADCSAKAVTR